MVIGTIIGGILLIIIALLIVIITILLYRNKRSKGQLDITNTSVAYKAAGTDLGANVVINPNPSYHPVKRESNVYSPGMELESAYDEIGEGSMIVKNPMFSSQVKIDDNDYVISAKELLATVN